MDQEHEESCRMRIYNKPMPAWLKLVLLVVNSVKLHLTAFKVIELHKQNRGLKGRQSAGA